MFFFFIMLCCAPWYDKCFLDLWEREREGDVYHNMSSDNAEIYMYIYLILYIYILFFTNKQINNNLIHSSLQFSSLYVKITLATQMPRSRFPSHICCFSLVFLKTIQCPSFRQLGMLALAGFAKQEHPRDYSFGTIAEARDAGASVRKLC